MIPESIYGMAVGSRTSNIGVLGPSGHLNKPEAPLCHAPLEQTGADPKLQAKATQCTSNKGLYGLCLVAERGHLKVVGWSWRFAQSERLKLAHQGFSLHQTLAPRVRL